MADPAPATAPFIAAPTGTAWQAEARSFGIFLLWLVVIVLLVRSFVFAPFSIPTGSMLPRLLIGDYVLVTKWNYGWSRHSLPWSVPLIPGRLLGRDPARGDVVVFKAPPAATADYVKRVIGLPGDTVQMRRGQLILNGVAVPKQRIADFIVPISPNYRCDTPFRDTDGTGAPVCRYRRYRETLSGGRAYAVLDQDERPADDTGVYAVPAGHLFLMGDNRDDSLDSRFPAISGGGIGFVPLTNVEGRAAVGFWSIDGRARLWRPWTWLTGVRWDRIGMGF